MFLHPVRVIGLADWDGRINNTIIMFEDQYQLTAISTQTTTTIVSAGVNMTLFSVVCPKATSGTVTLTDVAGSPTTYLVLPIGSIGTFLYKCIIPNGLKVVTSAADTVFVNWKQS